MTMAFEAGWWDAHLDLDPTCPLPFESWAYEIDGDPYHDGYTARWFPLEGQRVSCGNRTDLPRKQRTHFYVSMGTDFKNKGAGGITEVLVFACAVCGKDWR